jgi:predicted aspartyl protease
MYQQCTCFMIGKVILAVNFDLTGRAIGSINFVATGFNPWATFHKNVMSALGTMHMNVLQIAH